MLRKLILAPLLLADLLVLIGLGAGYLAGSVSPSVFWPLAFAGLAYPVFLGLTLAFTLLWALRGKWVLVAVHVLAIVFQGDLVLLHFRPLPAPAEIGTGLRVLSYNVHLFLRFSKQKNADVLPTMVNNIRSVSADIICLQEFFSHGSRMPDLERNSLKGLTSGLSVHADSYHGAATTPFSNSTALVTLSRFPIVGKGRLTASNSRLMRCIYSDLLVGSDTVRVYNIHLESVRIRDEDFDAMNRAVTERDSLEHLNVVAGKLRTAFINRAELADSLAAHIARSPYPVIVCGDFNDTPAAYSYQRIAGGMRDAFRQAGQGFGFSYARVPLFRIDHILHTDHFRATSHSVMRWPYSDHFAVMAVLEGE
jgi:endonuclease/exonuclease/phosphatase family metal-dependent hydrolase